jgi:hypothetical protein
VAGFDGGEFPSVIGRCLGGRITRWGHPTFDDLPWGVCQA